MNTKANLQPIPQPRKLPFFGNILYIDSSQPVLSLMKYSEKLGPLFKLDLITRESLIVSNYEYFNELCDETRFEKSIGGVLQKLREGLTGDGLLTVNTTDPIWRKAHNILMPCFSQNAMERYFDGMLQNVQKLISKWQNLPANTAIDVVEDMISLSLDSLGVCGFDYNFNLLTEGKSNQFITSFSWLFETTMKQITDLPFEKQLRVFRQLKWKKNMAYINSVVDTIIRQRRELGQSKGSRADMLSYMLWGVDEQTGERLEDVNIRQQIINFITIGHDTVSGLISFMLYALSQYPEVLQKATAEVDMILGDDPLRLPTFQDIPKLTYLKQVLDETLRLWPVFPAFLIQPIQDTVIADKYLIKRENKILVLLPLIHQDPKVWGEQSTVFNPDNFTAQAQATRPANAYKPFGNGVRACIAKQFAIQQSLLTVSLILKNFKLANATENYKLAIKEVNIFKPDHFKLKLEKR
jgi:cytochrome P450/NADPH-cytochrome P450 reductase